MQAMIKKMTAVVSAALLGVGVAAASEPRSNPADSQPSKQAPKPSAKATAKAHSKATPKTSAKAKTANRAQVGQASWYGKAFHGRPTASGEEYDMFQLTAAHRSLPLGTWVKVTNLRNGKWAVLKVNDRGPYVGNRILDVSYGAAQALNFRGRGVEKVSIEVVQPQTVAMAERPPAFDRDTD
jgi:rare lipoprotein A